LHHPFLATTPVANKEIQRLRAVQIFENAVRLSQPSPELIQRCCSQYLGEIKGSGSGLADRQLGVKIAAWTSSLPLSEQFTLISNLPLIKKLLPVMYADGLEDAVWNWLSKLYDATSLRIALGRSTTTHSLQVEDMFVSLMMRASIQRGHFEDAATQFIEATRYRFASGRSKVQYEDASTQLPYQPLIASWKRLSAVILWRRSAHGLSESVFYSIVKYSVPFSFQPCISKGFLMLYHPKRATTESLYKELQDPEQRQAWKSWCQTWKFQPRKAFLFAILDAAQMSLNEGLPQQSQFFLELVQSQWPDLFAFNDGMQPRECLARVREVAEMQLPWHRSATLA
jgi:hypothetical protein